jgi:hypothetical protein
LLVLVSAQILKLAIAPTHNASTIVLPPPRLVPG